MFRQKIAASFLTGAMILAALPLPPGSSTLRSTMTTQPSTRSGCMTSILALTIRPSSRQITQISEPGITASHRPIKI